MILHIQYLKAKEIVDEYHSQLKQAVVDVGDLSINQKVKRNYPESWDYWVSEIQGEDVLIRTTENEGDKNYDDFFGEYRRNSSHLIYSRRIWKN